MTFHLEPTGMGIRIALPGYGALTAGESVSWIVRPAAGEHPRLRNNTELRDVVGRAIVKRAGAGEERGGRIYWCKPDPGESRSSPEHYVVELQAAADVFDCMVALAREGKPPSVVLEPHGSGKIWDKDIDPQITISAWRADVQVTPDEKCDTARFPSLLDARLGELQSSITSARIAAWAAAAAAVLLVLLRLR